MAARDRVRGPRCGTLRARCSAAPYLYLARTHNTGQRRLGLSRASDSTRETGLDASDRRHRCSTPYEPPRSPTIRRTRPCSRRASRDRARQPIAGELGPPPQRMLDPVCDVKRRQVFVIFWGCAGTPTHDRSGELSLINEEVFVRISCEPFALNQIFRRRRLRDQYHPI